RGEHRLDHRVAVRVDGAAPGGEPVERERQLPGPGLERDLHRRRAVAYPVHHHVRARRGRSHRQLAARRGGGGHPPHPPPPAPPPAVAPPPPASAASAIQGARRDRGAPPRTVGALEPGRSNVFLAENAIGCSTRGTASTARPASSVSAPANAAIEGNRASRSF